MASKAKILVVDDDKHVLGYLAQVLESEGYEYLTANNTAEAERHLQKEKIDLVLCDIRMPDVSGLELCKRIKSSTPNTSVLIISGLDDQKTAQDAIDAGADGYIVKPLEQKSFLIQLTNALHRRKLELENRRYQEHLDNVVLEKTRLIKEAALQLDLAKHELREKKKELDLVFDTVQTGLILIDAQTHVIKRVNDYAAKLIGSSKKEIIGKICYDLICPADSKDTCPLKDNIGNLVNSERLFLTTNGERIPVLKSVAQLKLKNRPFYLESIVDLRDRKKYENALKKSQEELQIILDAVPALVFFKDKDNRVLRVNKALAKLCGLPREEIEGKTCEELWPDQAKDYWEYDLEVIRTGKPVRDIVETISAKDGVRYLKTDKFPYLDYDGSIIGIIGFSQDITELKKREQELQESEERYRKLIESANDGIAIIYKSSHIYVNKRYAEIFGYDNPEELDGKPVFTVLHPEEHDRIKKINRGQWDGKLTPERYEARGVRKDGTEILLEICSTISTYRNKKVSLVYIRDITERKKAEEALRKSEEKYRLVVENAKEAIIIAQDGQFRFANPAAARITGYTLDEFLSLRYEDLLHPDDRDLVINHNRRRIEGKDVPELYAFRIIDKNGEIRWIENSGVRITWNGAPASLLFLNEITDRKIAEDALRRAHADMEQLIASLSSILIELTAEGVIKRWNKIAQKVLGLSEQEAIGFHLGQVPIKWEWEKVSEALYQCIKEKSPVRLNDLPFDRQDSTRGYLGITITPKLDKQGELVGLIIMASDITRRRNLETQLLQAQKLESVGQLAAGIAHEINTPTQFVGDNTQFLKDAFGDLEELLTKYQELVHAVRQGRHAEDLLEEIDQLEQDIDLDFLKQEIPQAIEQSLEGLKRVSNIVRAMKEFSHPGSEEKTPIDINRAIQNTITVARNEWKYVADMETDFDPNLPLVPCLPGELNQVILNMIINAAHAIAEVVGDGGKGKGKIKITTRKNGNWAEIRISDTGTGIPEKIRSKIFDPFFTTKEVGKGTGQGLAIARSIIVDKHGGTIDFETEEGKGTTFIIKLPLKDCDS